MKAFENIVVPVPLLWQQQQFAQLCAQKRAFDAQHTAMEAELSAVMPAMLERVFA